ncbi:MAG: iron-sulfur cluster assembly scaffold protein [Tatlockia sp.]|jgi:nitrogen fixation NifU-like protein
MYNKLVESCFFAPQHVGVITQSNPFVFHCRSGARGRGDFFDLYLLAKEGKITQGRFKAYGNPYLIAGLEWLCRQLEGSDVNQHPCYTHLDFAKQLGIPKTRYSVALQLEDGYREIILLMQFKLQEEKS